MTTKEKNKIIEKLFLEKGPMLRGMASKWVAPQKIEDSIQDTMVKCCKYFDKFDPKRKVAFSTWAATILRNTCFDYSARKDRVRELHIDGLDDDVRAGIYIKGLVATWQPSLDAMEDTAVNVKNVNDCMGTLSKSDREVLSIRYLSGPTVEEYMATNRVSNQVYRARLTRARKRFRRNFQGVIR